MPSSASRELLQDMPFNTKSIPRRATFAEASACTQSDSSIVSAPLSSGVRSTESTILESSYSPMLIQPSQTVPTNYQLRPPPEEEYLSEADAEAAIHAWTVLHGYNVTKKQLERNKTGDVIYRLFVCDQWGKPKNTRRLREQDRVRTNKRSGRCGCPMRIKIVAVDGTNPTGPWKIMYTRDGSQTHNHPPSRDIRVHVTHRQRAAKTDHPGKNQNVNELIFAHDAAGISTSRTYATLIHSDKDTLIIPADISNTKATHRRNLLASASPIDVLFKFLQEHKLEYRYEVESGSNRLRYLLWSHPGALELAKDYLDVLVLDCTYKTNKYKYPLLNIGRLS
ncbi:hypothetical protein F442_03181 [Phytophthora nicotianae P10297]|uniref:FAR1 domain-containing protein n=1 Tax=Phytophthora nicotianae P10297 TaxID=1317064 RepID=W2ZWS5_PHYNI|nr:hypothetical protein F442_03181 [Phytophthora nicotianae P10297]